MIAIPLLVLWIGYLFFATWYELLVDPPTVELLDRCGWCGEMMGWKHQYQCAEDGTVWR